MLAHPEWSNDTIAEHCGFGSRSYFQTVFRKQTGQTPSSFLENARVEKSDNLLDS
ncbi:MAG: AraC family transcriptional regulator [Bacteroidales bacterium]|nr:AraC family transcriptional regulator [Bacteroidales bacterium]